MTTMMSVLEMEQVPKRQDPVEEEEMSGQFVEEFETGVIPSVSSDRCYTVEDIQIILGISRPTVYNLIRQKLFRAIKIGKGYRIPRKSFDAWLES